MAFIPRLFPACDLHLLVGTTIPLQLFAISGSTWMEISAPNVSQFVPDPNGGPAVSYASQALTGVSPGEVFGKFVVSYPGVFMSHAVHATVHGQLLRLFTAHPTVAMETGRKDRQITVYGEFQTGTVKSTHDITGHPYLSYAVTGHAGTRVGVTGHIETGTTPGAATITISQTGVAGGPTATVALTIAAAPTRRDILVREYVGTATRRVSILLLSEGFTAAEQPAFEKLCKRVVERLTQHISPYKLLRESLEVFRAFVASNESGATFGPPLFPVASDPGWFEPVLVERTPRSADLLLHEVVYRLGYPPSPPPTYAVAKTQCQPRVLTQPTYNDWLALRSLRYTRPRDTAFGLVVGQRHHAAPTRGSNPNWTAATDLLFAREANQLITVDDRRIATLAAVGNGPEHNFIDVQDRFVRTLYIAGDNIPYGERWRDGGSAFGLVIYLVNTNASQGVRDRGYTMVSNGGGASVFPATPSTVVPGWLELPPVAPLTTEHRQRGMRAGSADRVAWVIAHELAHTEPFGALHDEYAEASLESHAPPPPPEHASIAKSGNVQLLADAQAGGTAISATQLKWNWERVEAAAQVTSLLPSGTNLEIEVEDISRWPTTSVGRNAFLRTVDLARQGRSPSANLAIQQVDVATRKIRVAVPAGHTPASVKAAYPVGSRLILPLLRDSAVARLVDSRMIAAMAGGPFGASLPACSENPDQRPAQVAGFPYPANQSYALAAYESGASRHCGVVRGSGECVMRNTYEQKYDRTTGLPLARPVFQITAKFCFVCKYAIVDKVNAALHGELDKEYPQ